MKIVEIWEARLLPKNHLVALSGGFLSISLSRASIKGPIHRPQPILIAVSVPPVSR